MDQPTQPEVSYYYPEPMWLEQEEGRVKALLLFFDEIALLVPSYVKPRIVASSPYLAGEMLERGLLRVLDPVEFVDLEAMTKVNNFLAALLDAEIFERPGQARGL